MQLRRLFETVRHLPPGQILWRIRRRAFPRRPGPPTEPVALAPSRGPWVEPIYRANPLVAPGQLQVLGETIDVEREGWQASARSALTRYNMHYFACAGAEGNDRGDAACGALMRDWIAANPSGTPIAWDPYPISLRLVNWIKFGIRTASLPEGALASLAHQACWLEANLERDIRANHLFANGKALAMAGMALTGKDAARWHEQGRAIVLAEAAEQQCIDGGHFERSPMYHALFAEDLLDLINAARRAGDEVFAQALVPRAARALAWSKAMSHPDGEIAFFNDAAFGVAPTLSDSVAYAGRLGIDLDAPARQGVWLESGYARLEAGRAVMIADIAPVGPDYQPGHAHADTLSFELSVGSQRLVVNSGTSLYGTGPERQRQRGTSAHSTLEIDGVNSSDVWSGFRVGRRARARCEAFSSNTATGSHDGYRALPGSPRHIRRWQLDDRRLVVADSVIGSPHGRWNAVSRFHLHPDVAIDEARGEIRLLMPDGAGVTLTADRPVSIERGTWHPRFGTTVPNHHVVIRWQASAREPDTVVTFDWERAE